MTYKKSWRAMENNCHRLRAERINVVAFQWNINKTANELNAHTQTHYTHACEYSCEFDVMWLKLCGSVTTFLWHFILCLDVCVCVCVCSCTLIMPFLLFIHIYFLVVVITRSFVCSCFKNYYCLLFRLAYHVHILARYITVCILIYLRLKNYGYII